MPITAVGEVRRYPSLASRRFESGSPRARSGLRGRRFRWATFFPNGELAERLKGELGAVGKAEFGGTLKGPQLIPRGNLQSGGKSLRTRSRAAQQANPGSLLDGADDISSGGPKGHRRSKQAQH